LTVSVAKGLSHADLALSTVVAPGVVHEVDSAIDTGADDALTFYFGNV